MKAKVAESRWVWGLNGLEGQAKWGNRDSSNPELILASWWLVSVMFDSCGNWECFRGQVVLAGVPFCPQGHLSGLLPLWLLESGQPEKRFQPLGPTIPTKLNFYFAKASLHPSFWQLCLLWSACRASGLHLDGEKKAGLRAQGLVTVAIHQNLQGHQDVCVKGQGLPFWAVLSPAPCSGPGANKARWPDFFWDSGHFLFFFGSPVF